MKWPNYRQPLIKLSFKDPGLRTFSLLELRTYYALFGTEQGPAILRLFRLAGISVYDTEKIRNEINQYNDAKGFHSSLLGSMFFVQVMSC